MKYERHTAESYRVRAEELRIISEMDRHSETRGLLQQVAEDYERMAEVLDAIADTNQRFAK